MDAETAASLVPDHSIVEWLLTATGLWRIQGVVGVSVEARLAAFTVDASGVVLRGQGFSLKHPAPPQNRA